jgi:hypothetical protein
MREERREKRRERRGMELNNRIHGSDRKTSNII